MTCKVHALDNTFFLIITNALHFTVFEMSGYVPIFSQDLCKSTVFLFVFLSCYGVCVCVCNLVILNVSFKGLVQWLSTAPGMGAEREGGNDHDIT